MAKAFVHRIHVRRLRLAVGESRSAWALARRLSVGCTRPLWWWWHCVAKPCPGGLPAGRRQSHRCGQVWRRWRPRRRDHCGLPRRRPHRRAREGVLHSRRTTEVPPKAAPPKLADMKSCRRERVSVTRTPTQPDSVGHTWRALAVLHHFGAPPRSRALAAHSRGTRFNTGPGCSAIYVVSHAQCARRSAKSSLRLHAVLPAATVRCGGCVPADCDPAARNAHARHMSHALRR